MRRGAGHEFLGVLRNGPDCPRVALANDRCDGVVLALPKARARLLNACQVEQRRW